MAKVCRVCKTEKLLDDFHHSSRHNDGYRTECKECHKTEVSAWASKNRLKCNINNKKYKLTDKGKVSTKRYKRKRRQVHKRATPSWSIKKSIDAIYEEAKEKGMVVDHQVPLNSKFVCGLHCEDNLVVMTIKDNLIKGNRYWEHSWDYDLPHFEIRG